MSLKELTHRSEFMETILNNFKTEKKILLGVCDAERMDYLLPLLKASKTPFVCRDLERRINPRAIMATAESIIVIGAGSYRAAAPPEKAETGRIAAIAVGADYHHTVGLLLKELAGRMLQAQAFEYRAFVDAGHLNERALAIKAGLGFLGRNGFVISEKFGSFFNIGYMLTNLRLAADGSRSQDRCGDCRRCSLACASGALNGCLDPMNCVSYLTQKKSSPTPDEARLMGNWLYGCDACQDVCPFNNKTECCEQALAYPALSDCVGISDRDFDKKYKSTALYWRGAKIFRRNAAIALENLQAKGI